jgi:phosphoribosylanthranilate isomerase
MTIAVKICGLTEARGLKAAIDYGAAYVGFVFFRRSPRYIDIDTADVLADLVPRGVKVVGLFVDPTDADLEATLDRVPLDIVQLHGHEEPARVAAIKSLTGLSVMKAVGIATARDVMAAKVYEAVADRLLFDAKPLPDATRPGGNAQAAIAASGATMVDVSSGVESKPGLKSPAKIRAFMAAVAALEGQKVN